MNFPGLLGWLLRSLNRHTRIRESPNQNPDRMFPPKIPLIKHMAESFNFRTLPLSFGSKKKLWVESGTTKKMDAWRSTNVLFCDTQDNMADVVSLAVSSEQRKETKSSEMSVRPPTSFPNTQEMPPPGGYAKVSFFIEGWGGRWGQKNDLEVLVVPGQI